MTTITTHFPGNNSLGLLDPTAVYGSAAEREIATLGAAAERMDWPLLMRLVFPLHKHTLCLLLPEPAKGGPGVTLDVHCNTRYLPQHKPKSVSEPPSESQSHQLLKRARRLV